MPLSRRDFSAAILGTALLGSTVADGLTPRMLTGNPRPGKDFRRLVEPVPAIASKPVEVLEFFSYACPHCNAFEPELRAWSAGAPADVELQRVPVPFIGKAAILQRTFFALAGLKADQAAHSLVFDALHVQKRRIESLDDAVSVLGAAVGGARLRAAFDSPWVAMRVALADKLVQAYEVSSVPTLAVQGRYLTSRELAGSSANALKTVDYLIALGRGA